MFAMLAAITALFVFKTSSVSYGAPRLTLQGGRVQITRNAKTVLASDGQEVAPGDIVTTAAGAMATIRYRNERTQLSLHPGTILVVEDSAAGKKFELRQGVIDAQVAPQAAGRPMLIATSHARATVVGTAFKLRANSVTTKLDVFEGKVRFTCRFNSKNVMVAAGFSSTSDAGGPTTVAPLP
jgi:ferric-dicitrate binding protein FerR (iron transport regulator)